MYNRQISSDWDFKASNTKEYTHCYHNYPAMMIPQIARKLIEDYAPKSGVKFIFDPYMGSGTTLVEASIKGINSVGFDINPLAIQVAQSKIELFDIEEIEASQSTIEYKISEYTDGCITYNAEDFNHITKSDFWYSEDSLLRLKYLSDTIAMLASNNVKPFFNIALSETIREVSYTRNGEFKRYRIAADKIDSFKPKVFDIFIDKVSRNIIGLTDFIRCNKHFVAKALKCNSVDGIPSEIIAEQTIDMVVTSPPYGDSRTTVAYGQFSRWASEWFRHDNAKNIDKILMGGTPNKNIIIKSKTINTELNQIKEADQKRYIEVVTFLDEYKRSMINVAKTIKKGGRACYVVGNRNVKGIQIPLDYFTAEVFEDCGFKHEKTIVRSIPNKRMPSKTSPTNKKGINVSTMTAEYIVIMTKL